MKNKVFFDGVIYETAVYCGRLKEWRILNINTGTIYTMGFESEEQALASIEHDTVRCGKIVKRVALREIFGKLDGECIQRSNSQG